MNAEKAVEGEAPAEPRTGICVLWSRQEISYPFGLPFCSLAASLLNYRTKAMRIRRSLPGNKIAKPTDQVISCRLLRSAPELLTTCTVLQLPQKTDVLQTIKLIRTPFPTRICDCKVGRRLPSLILLATLLILHCPSRC